MDGNTKYDDGKQGLEAACDECGQHDDLCDLALKLIDWVLDLESSCVALRKCQW